MKKILTLTILLSLYVEAYEIKNSFYLKSDQKQINITCNNGANTFVYHFFNPNNYWAEGHMYNTMNAAAKKACQSKNTSKKYRVTKDSVGCTTTKGIKEATSTPLMRAIAFGGGVKSCFSMSKDIRNIRIIKKYTKYTKIKDSRGKVYFFENSAIAR